MVEVTCTGCGSAFEAKSARAKWCTTTCRQRAARARKAVERSTEVEAVGAAEAADRAGKAEHELVAAVRRELTVAAAITTVAGQQALQLARRMCDPDESSIVALSKELDRMIAKALAGAMPPVPVGGQSAGPTDDELTHARETRERKAREAAARA